MNGIGWDVGRKIISASAGKIDCYCTNNKLQL